MKFAVCRSPFLRWVEQVTGCGPVSSMSAWVAEMRPGEGDALGWHRDTGADYALGITVHLGAAAYDGGTVIGTIAVARADAALLLAGCLVSGGQLVICYHVASVSKLLRSEWRSGSELQDVMAHAVWGTPSAAALVRPRLVALGASWALMLGEALFPLALLLPEPWLIAALAAMFGFHIATAVVMRLATFPWAFVAAYPAVLLLGQTIREALA